ncbi:hypothetical protein JNL27_05005 [bacterium]|nr:hypothetical protein [bacterium]
MNKRLHRIFIWSLTVIGIATAVLIGIYGADYYTTPVIERNTHSLHDVLSPTGFWGHGMGFIGTFLIVFGVSMYSLRKRWGVLAGFGLIKHVLEFHIFLCLLGPALILYHTAFKFGGIVAVSFWSMVCVVASGVLGRYIYLQIPKSLSGKDLTAGELQKHLNLVTQILINEYGIEDSRIQTIDALTQPFDAGEKTTFFRTLPKLMWHDFKRYFKIHAAIQHLSLKSVSHEHLQTIRHLFLERSKIQRQIQTLVTTQKLFRYWHIIHMPFSIIMGVILVAHVIVAFLFGYTWIF